MTIMRDEIPFTNDAIIEFISLAEKRMAEIEKYYKEYVKLKKG